jgi:hypothetical protein
MTDEAKIEMFESPQAPDALTVPALPGVGDMRQHLILSVSIHLPGEGGCLNYQHVISADSVRSLWPGPPPRSFDAVADNEYRRRVDKADAYARALGLEIAQTVLRACAPRLRYTR